MIVNAERRTAMATSVKQMIEAANAAVPRITLARAREMIAKGNTLVVDVRDAPEVEKSGKVEFRLQLLSSCVFCSGSEERGMMKATLVTLAVAIALLAFGASEASAWVCRAGGVGGVGGTTLG